MVGVLSFTELKQGDRVRGVISGIYLGEVVSVDTNEVIVKETGGSCVRLGKLLIDLIPSVNESGQSRIWVT
jgi:hypothetical protein